MSSDVAYSRPRSDINAIILDYLTREGYTGAADRFCREAGLAPLASPSIEVRQHIQQCIYAGDIPVAISALAAFDETFLENHQTVHFQLLRLQLIEMIRSCSSKGDDPSVFLPAVTFAQENLAPRALENPECLRSLEEAMALVVYPHDDLTPELRSLLDTELRQEVANLVNRTILRSVNERDDSAIHQLLRLSAWSSEEAAKVQ